MGLEFEVKYRATTELLDRLKKELSGKWQRIDMETTYYDTADGSLGDRRYTLRRRFENGVSICALKTPGKGLGRGEWEVQAASVEVAIPELCKLGAPEELISMTASGVQPVCGARFTRYAAQVEWDGGAVEVALDQGILFAGDRQEPLCEVEVELKRGTPEVALNFAKDLAARYCLTRLETSKFRRALDLRKETENGTAETTVF